MRRIETFGLLAVVVLSVCGCDFMRKVAGRPTSEEIASKRAAIEEIKREKEQKILDSLDLVRSLEADSLSAVAELSEKADVVHSSILNGMNDLERSYYIIIGTFSQVSNAEKLASKYSESGYEVELLPYRKGLTAVALCPTDSVVELRDSYIRLSTDPSAPAGMWILVKD